MPVTRAPTRTAIAAKIKATTPERIARGQYIYETVADCASCHTADPSKPFAGGKKIDPANLFDVGPLLKLITDTCLDAGATEVLRSADEASRAELWRVRRELSTG